MNFKNVVSYFFLFCHNLLLNAPKRIYIKGVICIDPMKFLVEITPVPTEEKGGCLGAFFPIITMDFHHLASMAVIEIVRGSSY